MRSGKLALLAGAALLFTASCSGTSSNTKRYADDGYLGMSSANPNLRISPTARTNERDLDMMRQAIFSIPEVKDAKITVNGPHAFVNLEIADQLSPEETRRIENRAYSLLSFNVPRYEFKVTSGTKSFKLF
ncbi:hypothetical protein [Paenibacillus swuensis]|uniref:hypothetical protein n=1 Tax=Paenibacillus swuensis TaxID=1178515 RepID=UPI0008390804|nr:hypothetical protein [Paenibacillus swuensis]